MIDVIQTADHILQVGQTTIWQGDPYVVREVDPRPRCSWGVGYLNGAQQAVLFPVEVTVTLERFDGYDGGKAA